MAGTCFVVGKEGMVGGSLSNCVGFKGKGVGCGFSAGTLRGRRENGFFLSLFKSIILTGGVLELGDLWAPNHAVRSREV